jgi:hypothetical protein
VTRITQGPIPQPRKERKHDDFTSVLHLLHRLAAVFMQQAQANPSARVASCLPTGFGQRRVDLGFFWTQDMKTVHHIDPKLGDTFSFNCPVCGCAHIQQETFGSQSWWECLNGHSLYVSVYQSTAKTLNFVLIHQKQDQSEADHG